MITHSSYLVRTRYEMPQDNTPSPLQHTRRKGTPVSLKQGACGAFFFGCCSKIAKSTSLGQLILMQSDRWTEKGDFRWETKSVVLKQSKKCLFDPIFFDRAIRSAHPVEKVDFFNGMRGSDCSIEKLFEAHGISHHFTKHTSTPYNSSDAGFTATVLLLLLQQQLTTTRRGTCCSPPASSAYRHPMAAVSACYARRFCNTAAAAASCCCALIGDSRSPTPQPRR